jgi:N-methylhydantoinase B/oxoprolinase/acetone carboxylase alpha subunit
MLAAVVDMRVTHTHATGQVYGNLNAPPAVTASAVIYALRCMVPDVDIPLNQVTLNATLADCDIYPR